MHAGGCGSHRWIHTLRSPQILLQEVWETFCLVIINLATKAAFPLELLIEVVLQQWLPTCAPQANSSSTWEPVGNANCGAYLQTCWIRNSGGGDQQSVSNSLQGILMHAQMWELLPYTYFNQQSLCFVLGWRWEWGCQIKHRTQSEIWISGKQH